MKFAYADPPYLGCGKRLYGDAMFDDPKAHQALIHMLCKGYPDGWALSLNSTSLWQILPMCPKEVRIGAWCKSFASFKPGVNPAYAWEPVIWMGGRNRGRDVATVRDWCMVPITLQRGLPGAKPDGFSFWLFELLGMEAGDEFVDLFPGTASVTMAWDAYKRQIPLGLK